jgi:rSAM/selenodomain-associated transferase 2
MHGGRRVKLRRSRGEQLTFARTRSSEDMMKVSVIVPVLNEAQNILATLVSVKRQQGDFEIIVVDGGSTDTTVTIAREHALVISSERGRGKQMNAGARQAGGDVLLFLHADSALHPDALRSLSQTLEDRRVVGGTFTLRFDADGCLLKAYAFFTRFKFRFFHYGDQGIFVRRGVFAQLGGFAEIPLMEDVDFLGRLRKMGRVALIKLPVTTSARRFLKRGLIRQQLMNFFLVVMYMLGVRPETLSKLYLPNGDVTRQPESESGLSKRGDQAVEQRCN